ncbi:MAG TPA: hypothetical protein VFE88_02690 [Candidatus Nanoarchaeia archaeon]|nr:hypothetical protein [Candidatus Nanoarchaeia archaeon]
MKKLVFILAITFLLMLSGCAYTSEREDRATFQKALETQDPALCAKLFRDRYKEPCYLNITATIPEPALCEKIKTLESRNYCYINIAKALKDTIYCDKIKEETRRNIKTPFFSASKTEMRSPYTTKEFCYIEVAVATRDLKICDSLSNEARTECTLRVASVTGDLAICENIPLDDPFYKTTISRCFFYVAKFTKDSKLCDTLEDASLKELCYETLAQAARNPALCEKVSDRQDECYRSLATHTQDATVCGKISHPQSRDQCYDQVASLKRDPSLCQNITNPQLRDTCTRYSALEVETALQTVPA